MTAWTFHTLKYGTEKTTEKLELVWEVSGDPISDDYTPDEITAEELLGMWVRRYCPDPINDPWVAISWFVRGAQGTFEAAPFHPLNLDEYWCDFLTYFSWPVDEYGEQVQWTRLPVRDKLWRPAGKGRAGRADKGGFIQEATGWKPGAMQDRVHVPNLLAAAGFSHLSTAATR